jgi:cytochrome d ubiquinol oxidase subunit I
MGVYLVIVEGLWLKTRNPQYYYHARFWAKLYILNFGIGVAIALRAREQGTGNREQ